MKLKYTKIYLVAQGQNIHSEHRVTRRKVNEDGLALKPSVCQFTGMRGDEKHRPMGTLVLTEELWQKWYGRFEKTDFIPGMETALSAADKMVGECEWVYYGCPLCQMRWGPGCLEEAQQHAAEEMERLLSRFEILDDCTQSSALSVSAETDKVEEDKNG